MDQGAHYYKTELQAHTPRDPRWKGQRPVTHEEREQWSRGFVAACRAKDAGAVAITDHHDFLLYPHVARAADEETGDDGALLPPEERLVVFPGLELTLSTPCQVLLILDAHFPEDRLASVLELLMIEPADPAQDKCGDPVPIKIGDLSELHQRLDERDWLSGRYVILPNVSDGGRGTILRQGFARKYIDMPCVGAYVDGSFDKLGQGNRDILAGRDKSWGNKRLAVVQTSDARKVEDIGGCATWIKWAEPTAEALRQACLASESRIALSEPELPRIYITGVHVSVSEFMGAIDLGLNPQYNVLIGGRGTGKSTCLEYLRWALCDQPPSAGDDEVDYADRRARLIEQTLKSVRGQVEVDFVQNGIPHVVRRYAETDAVMLKVGDAEMAPANPDDIRALLPIEAYSQKQLSGVGVRLEELRRFVEGPIRGRLVQLGERQAGLATAIRGNFAELERYRALNAAVAKDSFTIESLKQQANGLRASLGGLSEEDQALLARKPAFDAAAEAVDGWKRSIDAARDEADRFEAAVARLADRFEPLDSASAPEAETLSTLGDAVQEMLTQLHDAALKAREFAVSGTASGAAVGAGLVEWEKRRQAFEERYTAAAQRSSAHRSKLAELEGIEQRQAELRASVALQREEIAGLGDPEAEHGRLLQEWRAVRADCSLALEQQCERLNDLSEGLIDAQVVRGAGIEELYQRFRAAIQGSGVQGAKIQKLVERVGAADDSLLAWHEALAELDEVVRGEGSTPKTPTTARAAFSDSDLAKIGERLDSAALMDLSLVPPDDHPVFRYRAKESDYIAFNDASAGQQATALLRALLNEEGPPLVIDQPEDDLDSKVVQDVVEKIWTAKCRRQLIFASHSANLVVNGDAELVACCDYRTAGDHSGGRIKLLGAIDVPAVREEITAVMEGGAKAFQLRKEKYGF